MSGATGEIGGTLTGGTVVGGCVATGTSGTLTATPVSVKSVVAVLGSPEGGACPLGLNNKLENEISNTGIINYY